MEALMAMGMTLVFMTIFFLQHNTADARFVNEDILTTLSKDTDFRACVYSENSTCINYTLTKNLPEYDFAFNISKRTGDQPNGLPQEKIFSESILVASNSSTYRPRILRIYYWQKK